MHSGNESYVGDECSINSSPTYSFEQTSSRCIRRGVRLGIDVGKVRVGIARCDAEGILAVPVATASRGKNDFSTVARLIRTDHPIEIYVGYPLQMDGSAGNSARMALKWAQKFHVKWPEIPVRMIDERLTSVLAHRQLQEAGMRAINQRSVVDQAAAVNILESALEAERVSGYVPGLALDDIDVSEGDTHE